MTTKHRAEELADELGAGLGVEFYEENTRSWKKSKIIEAATMLRQQQSEIAKLKSEIEALKSGGEPYAWCIASDCADWCFSGTEDGVRINAKLMDSSCIKTEPFPLFIRPAKTLTDDEILQVAGEIPNLPGDWADHIVFARALLKKASEK